MEANETPHGQSDLVYLRHTDDQQRPIVFRSFAEAPLCTIKRAKHQVNLDHGAVRALIPAMTQWWADVDDESPSARSLGERMALVQQLADALGVCVEVEPDSPRDAD